MGFTNQAATVALAAGSTVQLGAGSAVSIAPDQGHFWPCISGETYPPTFTGGSPGVGYATVAGQPCIGGTTSGDAVWSGLARYSGNNPATILVITGAIYLGSANGVKWGMALNFTSTEAFCATNNGGKDVDFWVNNTKVGTLTNAIPTAGWHGFELVYTATSTRLTFDQDPANKRIAGPAPASLDSFRYRQVGGPSLGISNLLASYPSAVPA